MSRGLAPPSPLFHKKNHKLSLWRNLSSFSFIIKSRTPQADPTAAGCGFYTLRCRARPGAHKTKKISQKGLTFCLPCGIILEQSARAAEKQKVNIAGWSSLVARRAHNPKVVGSNPAPATTKQVELYKFNLFFAFLYLYINGHFCDFARFRLHGIQKISCLLTTKKRKTFPFYNKNILAKTVFFCYTLANEYSCNRRMLWKRTY